jgi:hypothetical protein
MLTRSGEQMKEQLSELIHIHLGFQSCIKTFTSKSSTSLYRVLLESGLTQRNQVTALPVDDERRGLET